MNRFSGFVWTLCLCGLVAGGCSKKQPVAAAPVVDPSAPPGAPASQAEAPASGLSPAMQKGLEKTSVTPQTAAADEAYEAWFKKYGLDLNDPKMLTADPDGDGFTNEEEFLAGTDPHDPDSHPAVKKTMAMKTYHKVELPFVLRSVEGETAQIEATEGGEKKTESVRAGQTLRNSPYRVTKVQSRRTQDKDGNPVDASHVTLENPTSHEHVDLVKDLPARSASSSAVLSSADGAQTITVHQGETFSWPNEPGVLYVVKDLRDEQVILEEADTKKMWTVRKQ